ncbi:rho-related GTP-binding protein RhoQ [Elysia marginata]|uniref:Rho-related GTP-binding protein RhoQ n=1 Tax=Elysia marginata TaxID=1093978 RepID=A0AAV4GPA6_9GAST|nr:rho-related GTP-binding protein RhoQ [Elysia marginata]
MGGKSYVLSLFDTAGQEEYIHLRALSYVNCDVFLLCFSVATPESLNQARDKWLPELQRFSPNTPLVLVATQIDRRDDGPDVTTNDFSSGMDSTSGKPLMASVSAPASSVTTGSSVAPSSGVTKTTSSTRRGSHKHSQVVAPSSVKLKLRPPYVSTKEGQQAADSLHADFYVECSSLTETGISRLREAAIEYGLRRPDPVVKKGCNCSCVVL